MAGARPPVRIRFKYNVDTGEIEELLIDDNAPDRSEEYHDRVAAMLAGQLGRNPAIEDAGPRRRLDHEPPAPVREAATDDDTESEVITD